MRLNIFYSLQYIEAFEKSHLKPHHTTACRQFFVPTYTHYDIIGITYVVGKQQGKS